MKYVAVLGRQPEIGVAELESLYGSELVTPIHRTAAALEIEPDFSRLGGTVKLAKYIAMVDSTEWSNIEDQLIAVAKQYESTVPEGKLTIGVSTYGVRVKPQAINRTCLIIKKTIKQRLGRSVRVVPNKTVELSSAQVIHNKLTGSNGLELVAVRRDNTVIIARTTHIQDIEGYAARDQARPARDAKVGMLPPKLAQTLINLCNPEPKSVILDPFCGTGVVLQEATLMGYGLYGTDIDERMVDYTRINLDWLQETHNVPFSRCLEVADATSCQWRKPFDHIACETYLGRPFSALPDEATLNKVRSDVDLIHRKFLQNVATQTKSGFKMCIAVPAWNVRGRFKHLKVLDSLEELGYTRQSFAHVSNEELIYHREGQVVGRELVVLRRI